jgi:hypothetical protein
LRQVAGQSSPGTMSKLAQQYLPEHGGYQLYALLNSSGAHPGASRAFQFYGTPGAGIDYDFKGKHLLRAYWIAPSPSGPATTSAR